jgi:hypothetical protein
VILGLSHQQLEAVFKDGLFFTPSPLLSRAIITQSSYYINHALQSLTGDALLVLTVLLVQMRYILPFQPAGFTLIPQYRLADVS